MNFGIVLLLVFVVLVGLVIVTDHRSRQVRGHAARVRVPGGFLRPNTEARTGPDLSVYDAGQHMTPLTGEPIERPPAAD